MCGGHGNPQLRFLAAGSAVDWRSHLLSVWMPHHHLAKSILLPGSSQLATEHGNVLRRVHYCETWKSSNRKPSLMISHHPSSSNRLNTNLLNPLYPATGVRSASRSEVPPAFSCLSPINSLSCLIPSWPLFWKAWTDTHLLLVVWLWISVFIKYRKNIFILLSE